MKTWKITIITVGITLAVLLSVGAVIINEMATFVSAIPTKGFIVLDKQQKDESFWIFHSTGYYFKYGNKSADWMSCSLEVYQKYNVGDFCNETSWVFVN